MPYDGTILDPKVPPNLISSLSDLDHEWLPIAMLISDDRLSTLDHRLQIIEEYKLWSASTDLGSRLDLKTIIWIDKDYVGGSKLSTRFLKPSSSH